MWVESKKYSYFEFMYCDGNCKFFGVGKSENVAMWKHMVIANVAEWSVAILVDCFVVEKLPDGSG